MKTFSHYGVSVNRQFLIPGKFIRDMDKNQIKYEELRILDCHVVQYYYSGSTRYAAILPTADGEMEKVYTTFEIPIDLDWSKLVTDVDAQADGYEPMQLPTRLKLALDVAIKKAYDASPIPDDFNVFTAVPIDCNSKDFLCMVKFYLLDFGYDDNAIAKADSYDIDQDYLVRLINA